MVMRQPLESTHTPSRFEAPDSWVDEHLLLEGFAEVRLQVIDGLRALPAPLRKNDAKLLAILLLENRERKKLTSRGRNGRYLLWLDRERKRTPEVRKQEADFLLRANKASAKLALKENRKAARKRAAELITGEIFNPSTITQRARDGGLGDSTLEPFVEPVRAPATPREGDDRFFPFGRRPGAPSIRIMRPDDHEEVE